jgi:hypothetical protein
VSLVQFLARLGLCSLIELVSLVLEDSPETHDAVESEQIHDFVFPGESHRLLRVELYIPNPPIGAFSVGSEWTLATPPLGEDIEPRQIWNLHISLAGDRALS